MISPLARCIPLGVVRARILALLGIRMLKQNTKVNNRITVGSFKEKRDRRCPSWFPCLVLRWVFRLAYMWGDEIERVGT
jgi:hypothetical protein